MLTQESLKARYDYDFEGWLIYRRTGRVCGTPRAGGYYKITIDCKQYLLHQVIWLWHYGYIPKEIDHIDRNVYNTKVENLREATRQGQAGNTDSRPMRGIEKHGRKFRVRIGGTGWKKELGSYKTLEEAVVARDNGYRDYFGEFANV